MRTIISAKAILPYIDQVEMVLVMTAEPGFGGQAFMESQLETIREARQLLDRYHPKCDSVADGGISAKTAAQIKEAGANVLVAGSAVFGLEDRKAAIENLRMV